MALQQLHDLGDAMEPADTAEKSCTYLYVHPSLRRSAPSPTQLEARPAPSPTQLEAPPAPSSSHATTRWERLIAAVLSNTDDR